MTQIPVVRWDECYDSGWNGLIVPEAFAHPAKMARGLVARIFDELFAIGALERGDVVVDPFGGIGTTAIEGASRGVQVVCCELESRFVALAQQNFDLHRRDWEAMGRPLPRIVQGDSRKLRAHVGPVLAECVVSSPPYVSGGHHPDQTGAWNTNDRGQVGNLKDVAGYGREDGQLGQMLEGAVDAVISSPPYAEIASGSGGLNTFPPKHEGQQGGRSASSASQDTDSRYGESDGQLARMSLGDVDAIVSSPPFTQGYAGGGGINVKGYGPDGADKVGSRTYQGTGAERAEGNLETLALGEVDAVVSSPPFMGSSATAGGDHRKEYFAQVGGVGHLNVEYDEKVAFEKRGFLMGRAAYKEFAASCNLGSITESQTTFWSEAAKIVVESHAILKPGGYAVWVVKAFVRDKQIVDFPGDWRKLCEHAGFVTVREVHAMLVAETTHNDLFDGARTTKRERKSFFRRLAEKKGSPPIDFETVYFMVKPRT